MVSQSRSRASQVDVPGYRFWSTKFIVALASLLLPASGALADQVDYNLHLLVHDFGKLVASSHACKLRVDEEHLRERVLDVVSMDSSLDEDEASDAMNKSLAARVMRTLGCSNASVTVAQSHFERDLINLRYAIAVGH